ncbi:hypothetical protein PR048_029039 [Dryococelus australis]|uniref:Uncharacterized protein n=1 Tax=Dryococelus australis TaxID=614101 RepID=A0ABQ9GF07_9NEOP|nr:hypothetical protein PR048_029039 [Dryococelus australis]
MRMRRGEYEAAPECMGGGNGTSPRKPADQRHRPARFPHVKIRERPRRESNSSLVQPIRERVMAASKEPTRLFAPALLAATRNLMRVAYRPFTSTKPPPFCSTFDLRRCIFIRRQPDVVRVRPPVVSAARLPGVGVGQKARSATTPPHPRVHRHIPCADRRPVDSVAAGGFRGTCAHPIRTYPPPSNVINAAVPRERRSIKALAGCDTGVGGGYAIPFPGANLAYHVGGRPLSRSNCARGIQSVLINNAAARRASASPLSRITHAVCVRVASRLRFPAGSLPGFHMGTVPDDADGRRVFSGVSRRCFSFARTRARSAGGTDVTALPGQRHVNHVRKSGHRVIIITEAKQPLVAHASETTFLASNMSEYHSPINASW